MPTLTRTTLQSALPDVSSSVTLAGLNAVIDVFRDGHGIPHIRAGSEHDAFYAQGFVTAQDRLWHMDYDRHRAMGQWSQWVGAAGLVEDRLMRAFQLERASRADYDAASPSARAMVDAYTAGVNAFITTTDRLPAEYTLLEDTPATWEPWHCMAVYKVRNMLMGTYEFKLWRARVAVALGPERAASLFRSYPDEGLVSVPPGETYGQAAFDGLNDLAAAAEQLNWLEEQDGGSNAWVVSGDATVSGLPLVAGDSHRALDTPNVYYQVHMSCPQFRVSGYAVPGVPGAPHFSHTEFAGWGMTHGFGDYQDLFIERFRQHNGRLEYQYRDEWLPAESGVENIAVRDSDDVPVNIVRTQHGPVIAGDPSTGEGLAFSHTGTNSGTAWLDTVHGLLIAKNADEVENALREWTEPVNNFVYADVHGEYGYRYRGRLPQRPIANAWVPVPGWTGEHEWRGEIPFDELPHARNPAAGFVVTCNNAPTTADYPHYLNTYFASDFRAQRVTARLQQLAPGTADVAAMASIHAERTSIPAQTVVAHLRHMTVAPELGAARDLLLAWDCQIDRDAPAAALYGAVRSYLVADVVRAQLGPMADEALGTSGIGRGAATHAGQLFGAGIAALQRNDASRFGDRSWDEVIESALARAVTELSERLGQEMNAWRWGAVHHTQPIHPLSRAFPDCADLLNPPQMAVHGDADTPLAGAYSSVNRFVQTLMSVNRYIHDPSDWRASRWIVPLGASGHPGSPHYADQAQTWANIETIPQLWDWADIEAHAATHQQLTPK